MVMTVEQEGAAEAASEQTAGPSPCTEVGCAPIFLTSMPGDWCAVGAVSGGWRITHVFREELPLLNAGFVAQAYVVWGVFDQLPLDPPVQP